MNTSTSEFLVSFAKTFAFGSLAGVLVSIFTIVLIKGLAKRAQSYEHTYIPMTLIEVKLWRCVFIAYPLLFGVIFVIGCFIVKLR